MQNSLQIRTISFHRFEEKSFFALIVLLLLSSALYFYFISATILSVVDRTTALGEAKILDTKISQLESEYMAYGSVIDLSGARTLGYEEIAKIDYVSRTTALGFAKR
jgi:hypothetical protein